MGPYGRALLTDTRDSMGYVPRSCGRSIGPMPYEATAALTAFFPLRFTVISRLSA